MLQNGTDDIYFKHHVFFPQQNSLLLLQLKAITSKLGNISKSKTCDDCVAWMPGYTIIFHIIQAQHPWKGQQVWKHVYLASLQQPLLQYQNVQTLPIFKLCHVL